MIFDQAAIILLLVGMLVVFALTPRRVEVVALTGLGIGLLLGLVAPEQAFSGFANPAFITVVEVLLIVRVLARSGALEKAVGRLPAGGETQTLALLCLITAAISAFMNNIGALALIIPVVASLSAIRGFDRRRLLMPVSFAALLGGLCSVVGTPANLLVSQALAERSGAGFGFFDFAWVGVPVTLAGIAAIVVWTRPVLGQAPPDRPEAGGTAARRVVAEATLAPSSSYVGAKTGDFPAQIRALVRDGRQVFFQRPETRLEAGDVLLMQTDTARLDAWLRDGTLVARSAAGTDRLEAVVMPDSLLVGSRVGVLETFSSRGVAVLAVAARSPRVEATLDHLQLGIGDILFLQGDAAAMRDAVEEAELLALATPAASEPAASTQSGGMPWLPLAAFLGAVALAATGVAPPIAFGAAVLVLALAGSLNLRRGLAELDWPILVMLAAMIPLGMAVADTGAADTLAGTLLALVPADRPLALVGAVLVATVVITPFVNNATTAIVLSPVAIGIADTAGMTPAPFLMAVALGASIDFLTPIGHHNNTVVMGLAGYRFSDFLRGGWPVTLAAMAVGLAGIWLVWL